MHRILALLLATAFLAAAVPDADAQTARKARQEVEATLLVTGHVDIDRTGQVSAFAVDEPDKLPPPVASLVNRAVPQMRFEPVLVDGAPVLARAKMSLRMLATPLDDGNMTLRIASANFGDEYAPDDAARVRSASMPPPRYPENVARGGGKGTVYLLLQIGRDGKVRDVVAEQVNLNAIGTAREMESIRRDLARSAVDTARREWTFTPPSEGEAASQDYWVLRVPVSFQLHGDRETAYGQWSAYHPGELVRPDWAQPTPPGFSPDALVAGTVSPETSRFRLLTPLGG